MASRGYPQQSLSRKKAEQALSALLYGCTDERLRGFTAQGLAASYNVLLPKAEQMLAEAKRRRGV